MPDEAELPMPNENVLIHLTWALAVLERERSVRFGDGPTYANRFQGRRLAQMRDDPTTAFPDLGPMP
jgi:hypothetical protein